MNTLLLFAAVPTWIKPLWMVGLGALAVLGLLVLIVVLLRQFVPSVAAVAATTCKEALSQPLFYVLLAVGSFLLIFMPFVPFNTFGEDVKVLKESGLQLIMVLSIGMAVWTSSVSISEEIEGRIALTLLSKPLGRPQFVLGKFLGIVAPVALMFLVLGTLFLSSVSYKVVFESRETATPDPTAQDCIREIVQIAPGLLLAFMEAVVLTAIGVAISTRLPMVPNLILCASVYLLGHLTPTLVASASSQFEIPFFVAELLAIVLPSLETFNVYPAIATGHEVSLDYLGTAAVYCLLYTAVAMLLALLLFEDRDLA
jgi:ABC-type transport system involved in multi-copper enzyme maturation permease subunit